MNDLNILIPQYAANKAELDSYKKICEKENETIKHLMEELGAEEYTAGDYVAKYKIQKRESMNEEMLLQLAHIHGIPGIVKIKKYIDYDALEDAIYKDLIPAEVLLEMDKAREVKEVVTLRVTKIKKKKEKE